MTDDDINTIGELRDALAEYDDDTLVRVSDDGGAMKVHINKFDGMVTI